MLTDVLYSCSVELVKFSFIHAVCYSTFCKIVSYRFLLKILKNGISPIINCSSSDTLIRIQFRNFLVTSCNFLVTNLTFNDAVTGKSAMPFPSAIWWWIKKRCGQDNTWIIALCSLQCFDTVGMWEEGYSIHKRPVPLTLSFSSRTAGERKLKPRENLDSLG